MPQTLCYALLSHLKSIFPKRHAGTDRLFLHSINNFSENDPVWYRNQPLGVNTLRKSMKDISKSAGLSKNTQITALDQTLSQPLRIRVQT